MNHEKNIPAKQSTAQEKAWFSGPDADTERAKDPEHPEEEGSQTGQRLKKYRLGRNRRLRRRSEFQQIYREGSRIVGPNLVFFARPVLAGTSRLGITASRKIGSAVVRNRCRRRIRELFRLHPEALTALSVDLVVNARRGCTTAAWEVLCAEYLMGMKRIRKAVASS